MEINKKSWITQFEFDRLCLKQLVLPGSHDSGTYQLNLKSKSDYPKFLNNTVNKWAKTQNLNIYEQLCQGVRYLDLRIKQENEQLKIVHGLTGFRIETIFEDILRFSIEEPNEPILIDCNHIYSDNEFETCAMIENIATTYFKNKLVNKNVSCNIPLNEIAGKIWLFTTKGDRYFTCSCIRSWWADTDSVKDLKEYVEATQFDTNKLNVSQFILTIQPKTIILSYLNPFNKDTLEYFVKHKVKKYTQDMLISLKTKNPNVVLVDYVEFMPEILNWCITTNYLKLN